MYHFIYRILCYFEQVRLVGLGYGSFLLPVVLEGYTYGGGGSTGCCSSSVISTIEDESSSRDLSPRRPDVMSSIK